MAGWESMLDEIFGDLDKAELRKSQSGKAIITSFDQVSKSAALKKPTPGLGQLGRDLAGIARTNVGHRLEQQQAEVAGMAFKALTSFNQGKLTATDVSMVEARCHHLNNHLGVLQKALSEFDQMRSQIEAAREQGQRQAQQAAAATKARIDSILACLKIMEGRLDLSAVETAKLRTLAEGVKQ